MLARVRDHLTYANVIATIALVVALGGTTYAAIKLPANSVGSKQLKRKAVTPSKVSSSAVALFKGQKGDPGAKGDSGAPGAPGAKGAFSALAVRAASGTGRVTASCQPGEYATGGGAHSAHGGVIASAPAADPDAINTTGGINFQGYAPTSWTAAAKDPSGKDQDVTAWVVCATP